MTPERWQRARVLFEHASGLATGDTAAYLDNACADDLELLREVESLLDCQRRGGAVFLERPAMEVLGHGPVPEPISPVGSRIGPYQIIELLGIGGMGEVYRAVRVDGQYEAQVAVKLVRGGIDNAVVAERLRHERQILAGLDHPNIAHLLDGGATPAGTPYLVMELVQGTSIDQFCNDRQLSVTERLQLFRRVCEAVQYAHRRLIIHRDIKPSNILVTADGQPKLLDFGIARLLDPSAGPAVTVLQALTPEYASPEQFKGDPITTATDVYSLGVVLYRLLTGNSPYPSHPATPHAMIRAVCELQPSRPSLAVSEGAAGDDKDPGNKIARQPIASAQEGTLVKLRRRLEGDLDQIILKAMRKDPEGRYGTVEQLSDDIERHLKGLPVRASRGSWRYLARKFVGRQKRMVAAAAIVLVTLLAGVASTVRQARIATANGHRAERRFDDVRHLATSFLFEFHESIRHLPGSTPARELVVKRALEYLNSLSEEAGSDAPLRRELATAYVTLADVQGAPMRDSLGDYQGALQSIHKAVAILEPLRRASPQDQDLDSELARAYSETANLLDATGSFSAALDFYRQGLAVVASVAKPTLKVQVETTTLHVSYGDALSKSGDLAGGVASYKKAIAIDADILRAHPADRESKRDQAVAFIHLANGYDTMRMFPEALASAKSGRALFDSLVMPNNAQTQRDVAVANEAIAQELGKMGDKRGALAIEQGLLDADLLVARNDPRNHLARRDVFIDYYEIARLQSDLNQMKDAIANERRAIELTEAEDKAAPGSAVTQDDLKDGYMHLSKMLEKTADYPAALKFAEMALLISAAAVKANPEDLTGGSNLSEIEMEISDLQLSLGHGREALAGYIRAAANSEHIVASDPAHTEWRVVLARLYEKIGGAYARKPNTAPATEVAMNGEAARGYYQKSLAIWSELQRHETLGADYAGEPVKVARLLRDLDPTHSN